MDKSQDVWKGEYKKMNAIIRLKNSINRVKDLVTLFKQYPTTTLDMMDSPTTVTIGDLEILLEGLADRNISISKMPELDRHSSLGLGRIHKETIEARKEVKKENEFNAWRTGYDKGYTAGRDGELKRIESIINMYIRGVPND